MSSLCVTCVTEHFILLRVELKCARAPFDFVGTRWLSVCFFFFAHSRRFRAVHSLRMWVVGGGVVCDGLIDWWFLLSNRSPFSISENFVLAPRTAHWISCCNFCETVLLWQC